VTARNGMNRTVGIFAVLAAVSVVGFLLFPAIGTRKPISKRSNPEWERKVGAASQKASAAYSQWRSGGSAAKAEEALSESYASFGSDNTAYWLALVLADEGKYEEAEKLLRLVTHPTPMRGSTLATAPTVLVQYAEVAQQAGKPNEAKWALAQAGVKDWYSAYMLAAKHVPWDDHLMQADFYRQALEYRPDDPEAMKALANAQKELSRP
jgi:hypothetical protein